MPGSWATSRRSSWTGTGPATMPSHADATSVPGTPSERRAGHAVVHRDQLERSGNWSLVPRSLDCRSFGVNLVEIPPGGSIPEHDETERDHDEPFFVVSGVPVLVIDDTERAAPTGTFARAWTHRTAGQCATTAASRRRC